MVDGVIKTSHVYVSSQDMDGANNELTVTGGTGTDNLYVYLTGNPTGPTGDDELGDQKPKQRKVEGGVHERSSEESGQHTAAKMERSEH